MTARGAGGSARDVARQVLLRVEREASYAAPSIASALERAKLPPSDRALATEIVYGVLRARSRIDRALEGATARGALEVDLETRTALRVAAYQILFLDRVPAYAAVDDAVGTIKKQRGEKLAGFANALLRKLAKAGEPPLPASEAADPLRRLAAEASLPVWLLGLIVDRYGPEAAEVARAFASRPPLWLRVNTLRCTPAEALERLAVEAPGAELSRSPVIEEAIAVRGIGMTPSALPVFRDGWVAVQDLGAQAISRLLSPPPGCRVLDACAGLGGKTAHLAALMKNEGEIVAADISAPKLESAAAEWARLGVRVARAVCGDLTEEAAGKGLHLGGVFDAVLLDAPCSGLGVLRRHPETKWRATPEDPARLALLQAKLLRAVARHVKPGGLLVYGVCTFTAAETDELVASFEGAGGFRREPVPGGPLRVLSDATEALRTRPDRDDADAFFAVRLRASMGGRGD